MLTQSKSDLQNNYLDFFKLFILHLVLKTLQRV